MNAFLWFIGKIFFPLYKLPLAYSTIKRNGYDLSFAELLKGGQLIYYGTALVAATMLELYYQNARGEIPHDRFGIFMISGLILIVTTTVVYNDFIHNLGRRNALSRPSAAPSPTPQQPHEEIMRAQSEAQWTNADIILTSFTYCIALIVLAAMVSFSNSLIPFIAESIQYLRSFIG